MLRIFIHHDNNAEKLFKFDEKNNCPMINQITYSFFILNEFIGFTKSIWIFQFLSTFSKIPFLKQEKEYKAMTVK